MKSWIANTLLVLGVIVMLVVVNLQLVISLALPDPFYYTNIPFPVDKEEYTQNEPINIVFAQCSNEDSTVSVISIREIYNPINGNTISLPPGSRIVPPGCAPAHVTYAFVFPAELESGQYMLKGVTTFRGRFRTVDVAWQTQTFRYKGNE